MKAHKFVQRTKKRVDRFNGIVDYNTRICLVCGLDEYLAYFELGRNLISNPTLKEPDLDDCDLMIISEIMNL